MNPRPQRCERRALPAELLPRKVAVSYGRLIAPSRDRAGWDPAVWRCQYRLFQASLGDSIFIQPEEVTHLVEEGDSKLLHQLVSVIRDSRQIASEQRDVGGHRAPRVIRAAVQAVDGYATRFRGGDRSLNVFHPLVPGLATLHQNIKNAFDPAGILNPGRLYEGM